MGHQRRSISIVGFGHRNPIPAAAMVRGLLASSLVTGMATDETGDNSMEAQCERMFERVMLIMQEAGGSGADIVKMTVYLKDPSDRTELNRVWLESFPDERSRPARVVMPAASVSIAPVSCEILAFVSSSGE